MKKFIIIAIVIACSIASFVGGWKYTIYNQSLEVQSEHSVTSTLFGLTDNYYCE